jgi:hypothetical protein
LPGKVCGGGKGFKAVPAEIPLTDGQSPVPVSHGNAARYGQSKRAGIKSVLHGVLPFRCKRINACLFLILYFFSKALWIW